MSSHMLDRVQRNVTRILPKLIEMNYKERRGGIQNALFRRISDVSTSQEVLGDSEKINTSLL